MRTGHLGVSFVLLCGLICGCHSPHRSEQFASGLFGAGDLVTLDTFLLESSAKLRPKRICSFPVGAARKTESDKQKKPRAVDSTKLYLGLLAEQEVLPIPHGPRSRDRVPVGLPRSLAELRDTLQLRAIQMSACYRTARLLRPEQSEPVHLSGEVSPLGEVTLQSVEAETSHDQVLSSCLQAALYGLQAQTVTPRRTLFDLRIYFGHSSTNPPVQPLKPAPLEDVPRVPACVEALDPLPVDHLAAKEPLEAFDDAASESRPSEFRPSGPIHAPHYLPWTLAHNLGAYRACYRTALQSQPTLSGRIVIHGRIDRDGRISAKLKESSVASESLRECLLQAVAEVWVHPWPQPLRRNEAVEFDYPLQLTLRPAQTEPPEPPAKTLLPAERSADDFFDAQDDVNALRGYSALLRWQPQHRHALYWQKMEVLALYMAQPWRLLELSGDAVMMPLLSSLQRLSARGWVRRREPLRAMEVLDEFATQPHSDGSSLLLYPLIERAAARYALIASLGLTRPMDYLQHFLWAEALFKLGRYCEAAPVYKQVVAWPDDRKRKDAAYAAIVPWRNCLELEWLTTDSDARLIVPPRPTALDRRLIQAFEDYRRVAPEDTDSFRWFAEALLYHGQCAAAQSVAQELEQRLPGSEKAKSLRDHVLFQCRQQKTDGIPLSVSMH